MHAVPARPVASVAGRAAGPAAPLFSRTAVVVQRAVAVARRAVSPVARIAEDRWDWHLPAVLVWAAVGRVALEREAGPAKAGLSLAVRVAQVAQVVAGPRGDARSGDWPAVVLRGVDR